MPNLSTTTTLNPNSTIDGVELNEKTKPAIKSFFESKGAAVTNNADGSLTIASGWYAWASRAPINYDPEEFAAYVNKMVPTEQEPALAKVAAVPAMTFQYMQSAKTMVSNTAASVRDNKLNIAKVLAVLSALTAVGAAANFAYTKHKNKM